MYARSKARSVELFFKKILLYFRVRFEVLIPVNMMVSVVWDVTPCSLVAVLWRAEQPIALKHRSTLTRVCIVTLQKTPVSWRSSSSIGTATLVGYGLLNYCWVFSAGRFLQSAVASGQSSWLYHVILWQWCNMRGVADVYWNSPEGDSSLFSECCIVCFISSDDGETSYTNHWCFIW